jgi:hypothetical protein
MKNCTIFTSHPTRERRAQFSIRIISSVDLWKQVEATCFLLSVKLTHCRWSYSVFISCAHCKETISKIFPEKELRGHRPNFHIHRPVNDFYIPTIDLPFLLQENMWTDPGNKSITHRHEKVEIGTETVQFPEKEYINWIAVWSGRCLLQVPPDHLLLVLCVGRGRP